MEEFLTMSKKELGRLEVLKSLEEGFLTASEASIRLGISYSPDKEFKGLLQKRWSEGDSF